ncbi:MAG TPA: AarF/ABC1/UbiB kinase family protein [Polyangiaceae bacterium]|nr:AarF/ABC1/UbiB kinase family protein [Polyangiaceae bacterium]
MSADKPAKLPGSRLARLASLAKLGVRTGASALRADDGTGAAEKAAEVLGNLRGLAAKVGQMASYVDGLVPEGQRDAYEASLRALRSQAPRSSAAEIRGVVEAELDAPIDRLFVTWEDAPVASASIGQVHRATLHDGRVVAVKVQHPNVRQAVESDLASAGVLETFAALGGARRFDSRGHLETIRERFREELDYELEAARIAHFAAVHAGDPRVKVPVLVPERSRQSVLTTEFVTGGSFEEACEAPAEARRAWAETLWRFVFKGNLTGGMFNADPHPGNYVFHDDGAITFLDYGCVQVIPPPMRARAVALHRAACERDEAAFRQCVRELLSTRPGLMEDLSIAYSRRCFEPLFDAPYHLTRDYAASLVTEMHALGKRVRGAKDSEVFTMPREMLFMNRLQFGFYSVLARLDVEVDYRRVEASFLPAAGDE